MGLAEAAAPEEGAGAAGDSLQEKGFVVTSVDAVMNWARTGSLVANDLRARLLRRRDDAGRRARYDLDRFGIIFRPSPRQSDCMIVAGTLTNKMAPALTQGLRPDAGAALGCIDGVLRQRRRLLPLFLRGRRGCDRIVPVDVYVPGCPPTAEALIYGLIQLQNKIRRTSTIAQ